MLSKGRHHPGRSGFIPVFDALAKRVARHQGVAHEHVLPTPVIAVADGPVDLPLLGQARPKFVGERAPTDLQRDAEVREEKMIVLGQEEEVLEFASAKSHHLADSGSAQFRSQSISSSL